MKKLYKTILFSAFVANALSQVGHTTVTFNDDLRTGGFGSGGGAGRQIQSEIYYPAATTANDVPVVGTNLPVIVFGHGFSMTWDAYDNVWTSLVAEGYVVVFPRTESGISPTHLEFGKDLALVASKMQLLNTNVSSIFNGKLATKTALMGHSMGGGCAYLNPTYNGAIIETIVTYGAAVTNPSCVTTSASITIPNLIISGSNDCVAPPISHQDLIYSALTASFKTHLYITGGSHCYFANNSFTCAFGEATCSPSPTITKLEQQDVTSDHVNLWLGYYLKDICSNAPSFQDSLSLSNRTTFLQATPLSCTIGALSNSIMEDIQVFPNPSSTYFEISNFPVNATWIILDLNGRVVLKGDSNMVIAPSLMAGLYYLTVEKSNGEIQRIVIEKL